MSLKTIRQRGLYVGVSSAALLAVMATAASAWVNPLEDRYNTGPPVKICDQGSFFVGGVPKVTNYARRLSQIGPDQIIIGQMYTQFQIPWVRRGWPVIMVHGSSHTGAALEATPDGREGWLSRAVRNGIATFVVDQPGRGRSGFDHSVIQEARFNNDASAIPEIRSIPNANAWTAWFGHIIPEPDTTILDGTMIRHADPGDPDPPEDPMQPSEAHGDYPPAYPIPPVPNSIDPNIEARVGALGPAPNPANNTYLALEYYKQLVPNTEETLPGSFCEPCEPHELSAVNTWLPLALAELVERLGGAIVSPHSQSTRPIFHMVRILKERGKLHLVKGIIIPEGGGTDLVGTGLVGSDFDTIPFLMVNGDYRALSTRQGNYAAVAEMNASPTRSVSPAQSLDVEDPLFEGKLNGHTHMGMLGTTSHVEFDFFLDWVKENVPDQPGTVTCKAGDNPGKGPKH